MSNILTPAEAANFIRTETTDQIMLMLLPMVDAHVQLATGHDWAADAVINQTAKAAAGMLLTYWYDNPSAIGTSPEGSGSAFVQLEAEALKYRKYEFEGLSGAGAVYLPGAREGDTVIKLVGVYGVTGDQTAKFESSISEENQIVQTYGSDLTEKQFVVILKSPADDITA